MVGDNPLVRLRGLASAEMEPIITPCILVGERTTSNRCQRSYIERTVDGRNPAQPVVYETLWKNIENG